jgi:hypothetical protein
VVWLEGELRKVPGGLSITWTNGIPVGRRLEARRQLSPNMGKGGVRRRRRRIDTKWPGS